MADDGDELQRKISGFLAGRAESPLAVIVAAKALGEHGAKTYVFGADAGSEPASIRKGVTEDAVAAASNIACGVPWVLELPGAAGPIVEALKKDEGRTVFWSPLAPRSLFVTTEKVIESEDARVVARGEEIGEAPAPASAMDERVIKALSHVRLHKTDEERFVLGVVLEPDVVDSQGDFETADDIRKAAHVFMEHFGQLGKQHSEIVTGKLKVLESYLSPAAFELGEEKISKGTWLMAIRVVDDDLWEGVKKGDFTGFSIGGIGYRQEADPPPSSDARP